MTAPFRTEPSAAGEQCLVPGVAPISHGDRLRLRGDAPLAATRPQRPCDVGLFDLAARDQLDLFAALYSAATAAPELPPDGG